MMRTWRRQIFECLCIDYLTKSSQKITLYIGAVYYNMSQLLHQMHINEHTEFLDSHKFIDDIIQTLRMMQMICIRDGCLHTLDHDRMRGALIMN